MNRIQLISSPRNISTALMYSFANRGDTQVIDEPYYAYYLSRSGKDHPGRDEIIASQNLVTSEVFKELKDHQYDFDILFIKNMAKHFLYLNEKYLMPFKNILLIRNPYQLIASFSSVVPNPEMEDIGAKKQFDIFKILSEKNEVPVVIDAGEVLKNPEKVLSILCEKLSIPFSKKMLKWNKGSIKEDGIWAKYWYKNVHRSSGFQKQKSSDRVLDDCLMDLYFEAKKYYDILFDHSIKAK